MSHRSEAVKRWRRNTKQRMIQSMGGKCQICEYNKCNESLDFHHLDPNEKDFGMGGMRANPMAWPKIIAELRKCVLLCRNCHGEIHSGITKVPTDHARFDEAWVDYKQFERYTPDIMFEPCPVCGESKPKRNKTCSKSCAATLAGSIDWKFIDLPALISSLPSIIAVADHLGVSDAAVHKRMKKLGLK